MGAMSATRGAGSTGGAGLGVTLEIDSDKARFAASRRCTVITRLTVPARLATTSSTSARSVQRVPCGCLIESRLPSILWPSVKPFLACSVPYRRKVPPFGGLRFADPTYTKANS
jgi:hypothetical protein